jgi:hypothetical protein
MELEVLELEVLELEVLELELMELEVPELEVLELEVLELPSPALVRRGFYYDPYHESALLDVLSQSERPPCQFQR